MKHLLIIALLVIPTVSLAWKSPDLESICLGDKNAINITLSTESDYTIEFSGTSTFDTITTVDFVHSGSHAMHMPINGTLYARFASDHKAKTSVSVKDCTPLKEKKKSSRRKHKHGYIRRPVFASPMSAVLPLFDLPLFDYPSEPIIKWNLKD